MKVLLLVLLSLNLYALQTSWNGYFVDRITKVKIHDLDKDGVKELVIAGEEGVVVTTMSGDVKFVNSEFNSVETLEFMDVDGDGKDEILVANWLDIGVIDDDGEKLARDTIVYSMSFHSLSSDFYEVDGSVKVVLADQNGNSQTSENIVQYTYNPSINSFNYDWIKPIELWANVQKGDVKVVSNKAYTLVTTYEHSKLEQRSLADGSVLKEYNTTDSITAYAIKDDSNIALVALDKQDSSYNHTYTLAILNLDTFSIDSNITLDKNIDEIEIFEDNILLTTSTYNYPNGYDRKTYLFSIDAQNQLTQKFVYSSQSEELYDLLLYKDADKLQVVLAENKSVTVLDENGSTTKEFNLSGYVNNYINGLSLAVDAGELYVGEMDLYKLSDSGVENIYDNGSLVNNIYLGNLDIDADNEVVVSDGRKVYLYDDGKRVWSKNEYLLDVAFGDMDGNGIDDIVSASGDSIKVFNYSGDLIWEYNTTDEVLALDTYDIDNDANKEIVFLEYGYSGGDKIKIVEQNKSITQEWDTGESVTNIHLFEVVKNGDNYSILVGLQNPMRYDIGSQYGSYIDYKGFISRASKADVLDYNKDGKLELLHVYQDWQNDSWSVVVSSIKPIDPSESLFEIELGSEEIWSVRWFDYDSDGVSEILVAQDSVLSLYKVDGTKVWSYDEQIDEWNKNRFRNLEIAYQESGAHKIFTGAYEVFEFDRLGHYINSIDPSENFMVSSSYANPFMLSNNGELILGQVGVFGISSGIVPIIEDKSIYLQQGWNLISIPVDTTLDVDAIDVKFSNASNIWRYKDGEWQYHSRLSENMIYVTHNTDYATFDTLTKGEGFWVYNDVAQSVEFDGQEYNTTATGYFTTAYSGWHLLGAGTPILSSDIASLKLTLISVWSYKNGWSVYSPKESLQDAIEALELNHLDAIDNGVGFWINLGQ
ncbi:MAG: VCBS repeat-containing protein [Campylobacterales bacterium]|nr:VCBS repeat-containing protein [Campylobacterales bacterium]